MCVDDDLSVREAIVGFLEAHGCDACAFSTAESMLSAGHIDDMWYLIADVQLSVMSGLQLQAHLRSIGCDVPIIFITAFPDARIRARAQEPGGFLLPEQAGAAGNVAGLQRRREDREQKVLRGAAWRHEAMAPASACIAPQSVV